MSSNYLCKTCAVKHVGGEMQSFLPLFACKKLGVLKGMRTIHDGQKPKEVCPHYEPKLRAFRYLL